MNFTDVGKVTQLLQKDRSDTQPFCDVTKGPGIICHGYLC